MVRFRHSSVSGLPVRALAAAYLALHLTPPSSNRTCGFPASGSPVSSRLRLSQGFLFGLLAQLRPQRREFPRNFFRFFRNGTFLVHAALLSSRLKHTYSKAPSLHGHYPVSQLLWASPTSNKGHSRSYVFPRCAAVFPLPGWVSQVP